MHTNVIGTGRAARRVPISHGMVAERGDGLFMQNDYISWNE